MHIYISILSVLSSRCSYKKSLKTLEIMGNMSVPDRDRDREPRRKAAKFKKNKSAEVSAASTSGC